MPRLLPVVLAAAIAIGGLALIPSQNAPVVEPVLPDVLPEPLTQDSLLDLSASPEEVAASFMAAWVEGDGQSAAAKFTSDGLFYGYYAEYEPEMLPALRDWYRSVGQHYQNERCHSATTSVVFCRYSFENDLTRAFGWEPSKSSLEFVVEAGAIQHVNDHLSFYAATGYDHIWDLFLEWVKIRADGDFERMFNPVAGHPVLDLASIELWERYTGEFAAWSPAIAEAKAICRTARDRFDAALAELERATGPGPGPSLADMAESSEVALSISEQAVAELRALPRSGANWIRFDELISIWEAHTEILRQEATAASVGDGVRFWMLAEEHGGPAPCPHRSLEQ